MAAAVLTDALELAAEQLADRSAALELEAVELEELGHHHAALEARADAVAAGIGAERALEELVELEAERLLGEGRRLLAGILAPE